MELVGTMKGRRVNIACLQEIKWKRDKAKELLDEYKLYYIGKNNVRNEVEIDYIGI